MSLKDKDASYFSENWLLMTTTFLFTILPILLCFFLLGKYASGNLPIDEWFKNFKITGLDYNINNILLSFILVSYFIVFANLVIYIAESHSKIFTYKGDSRLFKFLNLITFIIMVVILVAILFFVLTVKEYEKIIHWNRGLSIGIFSCFVFTDGLLWIQEYLKQSNLSGKALKHSMNDIAFSRKSILLINIPALTILSLSLYLINTIELNNFFTNYYDGQEVCRIENFNLFLEGLETGVIFTSIIITQLIFSVLKIKWSYRRFQIENAEEVAVSTPPTSATAT